MEGSGTYYAAESIQQLFTGRKLASATVRNRLDFATRGRQEFFCDAT
ncbi:hypothetical protein [Streptomyces sp. NPDC056227]